MSDDLDHFLDQIVVDAYGEHEELTAFRQAVHDVARVEFDGDERRGLTAVGRHQGESYRVTPALCARRHRRWMDAALIFTNLAWINGCQTWDAVACLPAVEAHERRRRP